MGITGVSNGLLCAGALQLRDRGLGSGELQEQICMTVVWVTMCDGSCIIEFYDELKHE